MSDILCIGSVLWDVIGRSAGHMRPGADVAGRITRHPGGVAFNIALTLQRFGMRPALLSVVGRDPQGDELALACARHGMETAFIHRPNDLPTDRYMAIEGIEGLVAAIADAHSLEAAGERILAPLHDGRLATPDCPYGGPVALDGNLTLAMLEEIAAGPLMRAADLRVAPASPGKAGRLMPFLQHGRAVLYVNLEEAGILCQSRFEGADRAAEALLNRGAARAIVTDGARAACDAAPHGLIRTQPPEVPITRVTGAGDTFMAAHIAAEISGSGRAAALDRAVLAAAIHVSGDTDL